MGILIAFLIVGGLQMPFMSEWSSGSGLVDFVSLAGFAGVILLMRRKAFSS